MLNTSTLEAFSQLLAAEPDKAKRAALVKRAEMGALNKAEPSALELLHTESLGELADGDIEPPGTLVPGVIVETQVNWLAGHPAHGKTTIAMHAALTATGVGRDVLWLDWEGGKFPTARRMLALGASADDFAHFHYAPYPRLEANSEGLRAILEKLAGLTGPLVIFDSASKALATAGLDENSPTDATKWTTEVIMPLREHATVIVIDHVTKAATRSTPYPRGAGSKLADTEVFWFVEAEEKFNREQPGVILLSKHKDREGVLPERVRFSVGDGKGNLPVERIEAESGDSGKPESLRRETLNVLQRHDGQELSTNQLEQLVSGRRGDVRTAAKELASDPGVAVSVRAGERRAVYYRYDAAAMTAVEVI
jgi:AAA domain